VLRQAPGNQTAQGTTAAQKFDQTNAVTHVTKMMIFDGAAGGIIFTKNASLFSHTHTRYLIKLVTKYHFPFLGNYMSEL
jgi:hypothetical protein